MGSLFGKEKKTEPKQNKTTTRKNAVTDKDRAILDLKIARDKLTKYQKRMESESGKLLTQAQTLLTSGHKDRALLIMKIRKHKVKEAESIDSKLLTVMQMIEDIEWESHNIEVLNALKAGTAALNKLHEEMSLEDVEKLMEETNEAIEIENEISTLLAGQFSAIDETELEAELEALAAKEDEELQKLQATPPSQIPLPQTPTHTPVILPSVPSHPVKVEGNQQETRAPVTA